MYALNIILISVTRSVEVRQTKRFKVIDVKKITSLLMN